MNTTNRANSTDAIKKTTMASNFGEGNQGTVTLTTLDGMVVLEKRSIYLDYTIELEHKIGTLLNDLNSEHFCLYYGLVNEPPNSTANPKLLMEKIEGTPFMDTWLSRVEKQSLAGRTLAMAAVLNEELGISHNDLHGGNVVVRKCDVDVQAYVFPDGEEMAALTYGRSPVVIDFGLAFPGKAATTMLTTTEFSSIGYFPHEMDELADARRLIYSATYSDPDCMPKDVKGRLILKDVDKPGSFVKGTFPDFMGAMARKITARDVSGELLNLFSAQIRLPLKKAKRKITLNAAFKKLGKDVTEETVKEILNGNVAYVSETGVDATALRTRCKNVVIAMNNFLFDHAKTASEKKRKYYESSMVTGTRDIARLLLKSRVSYDPGKRVSVYDVKNRKTLRFKFERKECDALNSGELTLADVVKLRA